MRKTVAANAEYNERRRSVALMVVVIGFLFLISCAISLGEAIIERDWPRETIRFPITFLIILAASVG
jgi:hypothetical protein